MILWDPLLELGGNAPEAVRRARIILWKGYCSVHQNFQPQHVDRARARDTHVQVLVHPECSFAVVEKADLVGSTGFIIETIDSAEPGSSWVVGTEHHLVARLAAQHPDKSIRTVSPFACQCSTMYRIDPVDLMRTLEGIPQGELRWPIRVPRNVRERAQLALERMLSVPK